MINNDIVCNLVWVDDILEDNSVWNWEDFTTQLKMDFNIEQLTKPEEGLQEQWLLGVAHLLIKGDLFLISRPNTPDDRRVLWILDFF